MVVFDHWVPLGWWDMPDFFPEIFAEALVTFTMSASGPFISGAEHPLNHTTEETGLCFQPKRTVLLK